MTEDHGTSRVFQGDIAAAHGCQGRRSRQQHGDHK